MPTQLYEFSVSASVSGGATVSSYTVEIKNADGSYKKDLPIASTAMSATSDKLTLAPGTYTATSTVKTSVGDKTGSNCSVQFTIPAPNKVQVCDTTTGKSITVDEADKDKYKPVGSELCSDVEVCNVTTGKTVRVPYADKDKYKSTSDVACQPKVEPAAVTTTTVIPHTGPTDLLGGGLGLGSLAAVSYYYRASRRSLIDAITKR